MSRAAQPAAVAPADDIDRNHNDTVVVDDDNSSVVSDQSEDFDDHFIPLANNNVVNNIVEKVNVTYLTNKINESFP